MGRLSDLGDRLLSGSASPADLHPWTPFNELEEVAAGAGFVSSFANVTAFDTEDGLVLVDTGSFLLASQVHATVRGWTKRPLHTAIYTHGHVDHACGLGPFEAEKADGAPSPRVVAHEAVPARFDRYRTTAGWNAHINARQFRMPGLAWPTDYRYPDVTFRSMLDLDVGSLRFELHHARGETDDHCWVWVPARRVLCTGDFFIWALVELFWMSVNLLMISVIYDHTTSVAGWTKYEMMLLVGTSLLVQRFLMGFFWSSIFELGRNVPHAERYGSDGATYWVARRGGNASSRE